MTNRCILSIVQLRSKYTKQKLTTDETQTKHFVSITKTEGGSFDSELIHTIVSLYYSPTSQRLRQHIKCKSDANHVITRH